MIPRHDVYIESFFGSGAVFFSKKPSHCEIINDVNGLLVNFFKVIRDDIDGFLQKFSTALHSRQLFNEFKESDFTTLDNIEKAFRFYYIVRNSWCRLYRVNNQGKFNTSFCGGLSPDDRSIDGSLSDRFFNSKEAIISANRRLQHATIECLDYKEIFSRYDREKAFYFLDPPYETTYQYSLKFNIDEFKKEIDKIKGKFIITLNKELRDRFSNYNIFDVKTTAMMQATNPNEVFHQIIITNFDPDDIKKHGENFIQEKVI